MGYGNSGSEKNQIRGWRLYCSKRSGKHGCGRTIFFQLAGLLNRCLVQTKEFWAFIQYLLQGASRYRAGVQLNLRALSSRYRWFQKAMEIATFLRPVMAHSGTPIPEKQLCYPWLHPFHHLETAFQQAADKSLYSDPYQWFQFKFQKKVLRS